MVRRAAIFGPNARRTELLLKAPAPERKLCIADLSDVQLKHLVLAADTLFGSFDLVIACLDTLAKREVIGDGVASRDFDRLPKALKAEA